jgi:UDP-N-acetylmuramoyl-tripeptide--D-alanyl-D-alanine ligase
MIMDNNQHTADILNLTEIVEKLSAELSCSDIKGKIACDSGLNFNSLSIDSRNIQPGDLYVAIRGERFDGHDFVKEAVQKGAIACVVEHKLEDINQISTEKKQQIVQIIVKDCKQALGKIASLWREKHPVLLIAITGSCGKTTLKEMIVSILENKFPKQLLSTRGNLNNEFGVPLTLMKLNKQHKVAIIEMGANHLQEIAYLSEIAKPDIAIVTNAGNAHVEGFGSLDGVAKAKGEIYSSLSEQGYAVINNDDAYAPYWKSLINNRAEQLTTFAIENEADITTQKINTDQNTWMIKTPRGDFNLNLPVPGKHNVLNALAAIATCQIINVKNEHIKKGLEQFINISGRLEISNKQKYFTLINDSYNANPESVRAAIDVLASYQNGLKTILILGDMGELGKEEKKLHQQIGEYAAQKKISTLYAVGELSRNSVDGFNQYNNKQPIRQQHFDSVSSLMEQIKSIDLNGAVVLVKGSRKMAMENVVEALEKYNKCY